MPANALYKLAIDFEQYVEGDDHFREQLISLMIEHLKELNNVVQDAVKTNDLDRFRQIFHKMKGTILMLNDPELIPLLEETRSLLTSKAPRLRLHKNTSQIEEKCYQIVKSLEAELQVTRKKIQDLLSR